MRSWRACAVAVATVFVPVTVAAQTIAPRPSVRLLVDACVGADRAEVERIATIELRPSMVTTAGDDPVSVRVEVSCADVGVRVRVDDSITRKSLERVVRVSDVDPRARARWVAIAAAELVRASWSELDDEPAPRVEPVQPPPPVELVRAAQSTVARPLAPPVSSPIRPVRSLAMWGSLSGGVRALSASYGAQLLGLVMADFGVQWTPWMQARVGLAYIDGSRTVTDGTVRASVFEARASLHLALRRGPVGLAIGAGFAAGPALFTPSARNPIEATTRAAIVPWGGGFVVADASVSLVRSWLQLFVSAEGGVVAMSSSANVVHAILATPRTVESAFALEGFWGSAMLGVRVGRM